MITEQIVTPIILAVFVVVMAVHSKKLNSSAKKMLELLEANKKK